MAKNVLETVLTKEQREAGLYLEEFDDHAVGLFNSEGCQLAAWNATRITVAEIRKEADTYLRKALNERT